MTFLHVLSCPSGLPAELLRGLPRVESQSFFNYLILIPTSFHLGKESTSSTRYCVHLIEHKSGVRLTVTNTYLSVL